MTFRRAAARMSAWEEAENGMLAVGYGRNMGHTKTNATGSKLACGQKRFLYGADVERIVGQVSGNRGGYKSP